MDNQIFSAILIITLAWTQSSFAKSPPPQDVDKIVYGKPILSGKGCPKDGAQFTPAPDSSAFTLLFDRMQLETTNSFASLSCQIIVPIQLQKGFRLSLQSIEMRGFQQLKKKSATVIGVLSRFYKPSTQKITAGEWATKTTYGIVEEDFDENYVLNAKHSTSYCGGVQYLIFNAGIWMWNWNQREISNLAVLDSVDGNSQLSGQASIEKCH